MVKGILKKIKYTLDPRGVPSISIDNEQYAVLKSKGLIPEGVGIYTKDGHNRVEIGYDSAWTPGALRAAFIIALYAPRILEHFGHGIIPDFDIGSHTVPPHQDIITHPESIETIAVPAHDVSVAVPAHDVSVAVPAHTETENLFDFSGQPKPVYTDIPAHTETMAVPAHTETMHVPEHTETITNPAYTETIDVPATTERITVNGGVVDDVLAYLAGVPMMFYQLVKVPGRAWSRQQSKEKLRYLNKVVNDPELYKKVTTGGLERVLTGLDGKINKQNRRIEELETSGAVAERQTPAPEEQNP